MKKFKYLLVIFGFMLCMIPNVNAELNYDYEFEITKRSYDDLPFSNWYAVNEVANYDNRNYVKIYGTNENIHNMPRYLYLIYCGTGTINFATTSVSTGNISNDGATWGSSCTLANGYEGTYRLNRWTITEWGDLSSSSTYEWGVIWSVRVHNTLGYNVYIDVESVFLSNELIQDFSSEALLTEILAQNSNLKNSLNEIKSSQNNIEDSVNTTNNKLDTTNEELGKVNSNITSTDTTNSQNQANSFFEGFDTNDYGLSDIVTMPLELIRGLTSNSCVSLSLTLPFVNKTFELPCMSSIYQEYFGSFYDLYQLITFGFISYWVIVRIFNLVKDFKNPDHDEIEVLDL